MVLMFESGDGSSSVTIQMSVINQYLCMIILFVFLQKKKEKKKDKQIKSIARKEKLNTKRKQEKTNKPR